MFTCLHDMSLHTQCLQLRWFSCLAAHGGCLKGRLPRTHTHHIMLTLASPSSPSVSHLGHDGLVVTSNHPPKATAFSARKVTEKQSSVSLGKSGPEQIICNGEPNQLVQISSQPVASSTKLVFTSPPYTESQITPLCQQNQASILLQLQSTPQLAAGKIA